MADYPDDGTYAEPDGKVLTATAEPGAEILTVTNMVALAGAVLIIGTLLERFAGMDPAYTVSRAVSVPLLVTAVVVGARRRNWASLILPTIGLALVATTFLMGG